MLQALIGLFLIGIPTGATAQVPSPKLPTPTVLVVPSPTPSPTPDFTSTTTVRDYIVEQARLRRVSTELALEISECESAFLPQQSHYPDENGPNGREDSWGIWQINLPGKNITRAQAMDVEFSTNWALDQLKQGNAHIWSCAK